MRIQLLLVTSILLLGTQVNAQGILGKNLVVNGDAESGPAGMDVKTPIASIPGWTLTGKPTVLPYNLTGFVQLTDPTPPDHGFQYFAAAFPSLPGTLSQDIDVSSAASLINAGNIKFTASAYLGSIGGVTVGAQVDFAFKNSKGQTFSTTTVGPIAFLIPNRIGMFFQQQIGLVPAGTTTVTVKVTLQDGNLDTAIADSISFVLSQESTTPVLGTNLIVNGGAEAGPAVPLPPHVPYVPGWSTTGNAGSVSPYGGPSWISSSDPGPPDRGVNVFSGWFDGADLYQDIDVTGASTLIDANQVTFQVSGWLGGVSSPSTVLKYIFYDWSGKQLAPTAQLTQPSQFSKLLESGASGPLPSGTRRVRISLVFTSSNSIADNIVFTLSAPNAPPVISPAGILSAGAFGGFTSISPGSWIEIYGVNLASTTQGWSGTDFNNGVGPTSLGGVQVTVAGKPAFIDYVSPTQVNALVPSDAPVGSGTAAIVVTTSNGPSDPYGIYVNSTEPGVLAPPSFQIGGKQYVAALFSDGQTFALPAGAIAGVASRPAKPGETLTIYGVGFGPVTGGWTAGTIVNAQNTLTAPLQFLFGSTPATLSYDGLAPSFTGLYQLNVVVPKVNANNATPVSFNLGGTKNVQTLYIAVGQ